MIRQRAESPSTSHSLPLPPPIILSHTRASMAMMRAAAPSTYILASPSEAPPSGIPPLLPIPLPTPSPPLLLPSTDLRANRPKDTYEIYGRLDDAQDDRSLMIGRLNMLFRDRRKITVATLVEEQMSPWKGNLPKLPIESNIGDEERLYDELHKLETSFGVLACPFDVAAKKRDKEKGDVSTFPTKGMRSIISMILISLEGFLASILLLMVIIVAAVIVTVIRVIVVVVIVGVVIVVAIIGGSPPMNALHKVFLVGLVPIFIPEASPKDIYDYYVHGLVDTLYINGNNLKEIQEFPLKVQGIIKSYKEVFSKERELFLRMHSSYPIFDREQKILVPSITVAQLGVSNHKYLDKEEKIERTTPTMDDLAFSLAEVLAASTKIGTGSGQIDKVKINYCSENSTLRGQGILVIKVRTGGGDVVRLGAELERLWCKVEVCGGVCGGDLAAATLRLQGRDVASFRAKR
ncbi:hypothetical protein Tco_0617758 [Tanacetum coccineum]